jgi:invasion protein IalB
MRPWKHRARGDANRGNSLAAGFGRLLRAIMTASSLALALFFGLTVAASAQGAVRSVHGDWQIRCDTPPGAQAEQCLKLDNQDVGRAGFVRCLPNGCVAEVVMDDKLLSQLRTAKTATFIIFETPEEGIGFPLSLNGIGEGYDKLP